MPVDKNVPFGLCFAEPRGVVVVEEQVRRTEFTVTFEGDAVRAHEIDAQILANSLFNIAEAMKRASTIIYGDEAETIVRVKSGFKEGSFRATIVDFINAENLVSFDSVCNILGFSAAGGVIGLVKKLKGSSIKEKKLNPDGKTMTVTGDNNVVVNNVNISVIKAYGDMAVRKSIEESLAPVANGALNFIKYGSSETGYEEEITKEDSTYFKSPPSDTLKDSEEERFLFVVKSDLRGNHKGWRFTEKTPPGFEEEGDDDNGDESFKATVSDNAFLRKIKDGELEIHVTDLLHVSMRTIQKKVLKRVSTERFILQVHRIFPEEEWAQTDFLE